MGSTSLHLHLHLHLHAPLSPFPHRSPSRLHRSHKPLLRPNPNNLPLRSTSSISASPSPSPSPSESNESRCLRDEQRWLREEQRWLREEKRWLREESRWNAERESLLREIAALRERLEAIERGGRDPVSVEVLLKALKERGAPPPVLVQEAEVKEMVLEGAVEKEDEGRPAEEEEERRTVRKGSEGEDVRAMQDALERFGFYSGEEDMEYHVFSDGTERAVKAWQASLGVHEDGIMTSELQRRLFAQLIGGCPGLEARLDNYGKDESNGAPVASVTGTTEPQQTVIIGGGNKGVEVPPHIGENKVFLIGENRWEEPSRLVNKDKPMSKSEDASLVTCLTCRGEGRLMCTECDGSGEPNIEPQFLEWVDEGTKCPYCEGLGYTICDVCDGKTVVEKGQF